MWICFQVVILLAGFAQFGISYRYRFNTENDNIFSECMGQPDNVLPIEGLADISDLIILPAENGMTVRGNITTIWNIEPTDTIVTTLSLNRFERGEWVKSLLSMTLKDTCSVLYEKGQLWYDSWTKHVINAEDVKSKCLNVPGTVLMHETFVLEMIYDFNLAIPSGLHKLVIHFKAYDENQKERDTSVCIEILGYVLKI